MQTNDIKKMVVQLSAATNSFEARAEKSVQAVKDSADEINKIAHQAATTSEAMAQKAVDALHVEASKFTVQELNTPVEHYKQELQNSINTIHSAANRLEEQIHAAKSAHTMTAWKAFIASLIASVAVIAVAYYYTQNAAKEIKRNEWITSINKATSNGKLVACPKGGICAHINNKLIRLDQ